MRFIITIHPQRLLTTDEIEVIRENLREHVLEEKRCEVEGFAKLTDENPTVDYYHD